MTRLFAFTTVLVCTFGQHALSQGNLTPPGAPTPTMKTLDQIEPRTPISSLPFTITAAGSYFVTRNLTGTVGQHGITIDANNVTLDLGGFELVGPVSGITNGIRIVSGRTNATVRNGTVRGWLGSGIGAENSTCTDLQVEGVRAFNCGINGILLGNNGTARECVVRASGSSGILGGFACKIFECTVTGAGSYGIKTSANGVVTHCVASDNVTGGIWLGGLCVVTGSTATGNFNNGFTLGAKSSLSDCIAANNGSDGINCSTGCTLQNCSATDNFSNGISLVSGSTLSNCTAYNNGGNGIEGAAGIIATNCSALQNDLAGFSLDNDFALENCSAIANREVGIYGDSGGTLINCSAHGNIGAAGIFVFTGCTLIGCIAQGNTSNAATSAGITTQGGCYLSQCSVTASTSTAATHTAITGMGLSVGANCTIEYCTVLSSKGDGIRCGSGCLILSNLCSFNGYSDGDGAGIHAIGSDVRVEGNTVIGNDRGIEVAEAGGLIIKSDANGNSTDYVIAAGNHYGPIINLTAIGTPAVNGNTAAGTLTTSDPWANFSH